MIPPAPPRHPSKDRCPKCGASNVSPFWIQLNPDPAKRNRYPLAIDYRRSCCKNCDHVDLHHKFSTVSDEEQRFFPQEAQVLTYAGEMEKPLIWRGIFFVLLTMALLVVMVLVWLVV